MSLSLPSIIANAGRVHHPLILLQSSLAQSCLSILRTFTAPHKNIVVLFCLLHQPNALLDEDSSSEQMHVVDWTDRVPGYSNEATDYLNNILQAVQAFPDGSLTVIIDSVDTLVSNVGSTATTVLLLKELLALIVARGAKSRLVLHMLASCPLKESLIQTRFSPSVAAFNSYPAALLRHVADEYMTPPPPLTAPEKFWNVFLPIAQREHESEKLVFGSGGPGCEGEEFVVELVLRSADGSSRRRVVERLLEGWRTATSSACEVSQLADVRSLWSKRPLEQTKVPDPTQNASFNLNLTPEQQQSRSQVPLPYAADVNAVSRPQEAVIFYDPDSADDMDDEDPDEDLDI